jgi:phosphoribosylanthranilate isomerase
MNPPNRKRVKICGITSIEDAQTVCDAGVDAIGLVFYEKSPRNVSIQQAKAICESLPPFVTSVGLFLDAPKEFVESVLAEVSLDLLQFHGSEQADYCESFKRPYIKAIGMQGINDEAEFNSFADEYPRAKGFLVDSHAAGKAGGTGQTFNWENLPRSCNKPIILAGGLNPENTADAIKIDDIYGIDLSSGVESSPGIKDPQKIQQLMTEVYRVQCNE